MSHSVPHRLIQLMRAWPALVIAALITVADSIDTFGTLDAWSVDTQFTILRSISPEFIDPGITIVAIDDEAIKRSGTPLSLWHPYLARLLDRIAEGRPKVVALDLVLPDRSYEQKYPVTDSVLMKSMMELRQHKIPMVLAFSLDGQSQAKPLWPPYMALVDREYGLGSDVLTTDRDLIVRRHTEDIGVDGTSLPTFAGQVVRAAGIKYKPGMMNYRVQYNVPVISALQLMGETDSATLTDIHGRVVIIGGTLPDIDRMPQPVPLSTQYPAYSQPGVFVQANLVAGMITDTLVRTAPVAATYALIWLGLLSWPVSGTLYRTLILTATVPIAFAAMGLLALANDIYVPIIAPIISALLIVAARFVIAVYQSRKQLLIDTTRVDAQRELIDAVVHDLVAPIGAMRTAAELLRMEKNPSGKEHYGQMVDTAARLLEFELDALLSMAKINVTGRVSITQTQFDLYSLVEDVYSGISVLAQAKGLTTTLAISASVEPQRIGGKNEIGRILQNILGNAVKHSQEGIIRLKVMCGVDDDYVRFEIKDDAGGIPQGQIEKIFNKYQKYSDNRPGVGLGLSIVKQFAHQLGGRVGINSAVGKGSTVWLELPLLRDSQAALQSDRCYTDDLVNRIIQETATHASVIHRSETSVIGDAIAVILHGATDSHQKREIHIRRDGSEQPWESGMWRFGIGAVISSGARGAEVATLLRLASDDLRMSKRADVPNVGMASTTGKSMRLLLVDDNAIIRKIWANLFRNEGFEVDEAGCADEALDFVRTAAPDIIVLDERMPDMPGSTLAAKIRSMQMLQNRNLPIVILTADSVGASAWPSAVSAVISKAETPQRVVTGVKELLA